MAESALARKPKAAGGVAYVEAGTFEATVAGIARAAVDDAWSHVGPGTTIETLIREAMRRCSPGSRTSTRARPRP